MTGQCGCGCATVWTVQTDQIPGGAPDRRVQRRPVTDPAPTLTGSSSSWAWCPPGTPHTNSKALR